MAESAPVPARLRRGPGKHPFDRDILRLSVPALGSLIAEPLYLLTDTAVVGRLGTAPLGGLAVAASVLTAVFWVFNFLQFGTTAAVARLVGAGDRRSAADAGAQSLWLGALLGGIVTATLLIAAPGALSIMGASDDVRPYALTYLRISALGAPALLIAFAGMGYLRGTLDTRTPLLVAVASNVANLVIELFLVFVLDTGVAGSAAATVIAQWGAAVVFIAVVARDVRRAGARVHLAWRRVRALLVTGRDLLVRTGSLLIALTTATAVASRIGDVELAAHQVALQVWLFLALVLDAIAIAAQAMIGRFLGAARPEDAREAAARMLWWGLGIGVPLGVAILAARPWLAGVFSDDGSVVSAAATLLVIVAVMQPLNAVVFVLDGVLIGAGDTRYLAKAMAVAGVVVFLPAALAVHLTGGGLVALWSALCLLMAARAAGLWWRFVRTDTWAVVGAER